MLARKIYELLSSEESSAGLRTVVAQGIPAYRLALSEQARVAPVDVTSDESLLVIAASHLQVLCKAFLADQIDETELNYIAIALDRGEDFEWVSKEVEECAYFLSLPETNGTPLTKVVPTVLRALREHAA